MKPFIRRSMLALAASIGVFAQPAQPPTDPAVRQRNSIAAMQESVAKQQAAIQKQVDPSGNAGFFVLPRAASLGGVTAAVSEAFSPPPELGCDPLPAMEVNSLIGETAQRDGLNPDLLRSVMKQESAFRPCAVSSKGALGLMQLMPATAEQFGLENPFDAAGNLDAGARFLKQLLNKYAGDVPKALGAYNAGPSKVDATGGVPAIPETMDYVRQILSNMIQ